MWVTVVFFRSGYNGEALGKFRYAVVFNFNEYGETQIFPAGVEYQNSDFWVFARFFFCGMVSFFFLFFYALMEFYQLRVAQFYFISFFFFRYFSVFLEAFVGVT
ncbi:hypothetical protein EHS14_03110, partial [Schaalia georgiae]